MSSIVLIGPPGTGKTATGEALAELLGIPFIDLDNQIEDQAGIPITEIFKRHGETFFRDLETEALRRVASGSLNQSMVLASGGGAPVRPENWQLLQEIGTIVCLMASEPVLIARLSGAGDRPLLNAGHPEDIGSRLRNLLESRQSIYRQAHLTVDTSDLPPLAVAKLIVKLLNNSN